MKSHVGTRVIPSDSGWRNYLKGKSSGKPDPKCRHGARVAKIARRASSFEFGLRLRQGQLKVENNLATVIRLKLVYEGIMKLLVQLQVEG